MATDKVTVETDATLTIKDSTGTVIYQTGGGSQPPVDPPVEPPPTDDVTIKVGPNEQYKTLASAVSAARDGDVIGMAAGTYTDDFCNIGKRLTIKGTGGMAHLRATKPPPNGKAILVTTANVVVEKLEFSGAAVADKNGAGIRHESGSLTVNKCFFHDNQDGILASDNTQGTITITSSEFAANGAGDGQSHNIYVNHVKLLTIDSCYFHDAKVGHEIKSRALATTITDTRIYDNQATASYSVDLPNGGNASITGCIIQQGNNSQNPIIVAYGAEGNMNANSSLEMDDNQAVNDKTSSSSKLLNNASTVRATLSNTQVYGLTSGQISSGPVAVSGTQMLAQRPTLDTSSPWQ